MKSPNFNGKILRLTENQLPTTMKPRKMNVRSSHQTSNYDRDMFVMMSKVILSVELNPPYIKNSDENSRKAVRGFEGIARV